MDKTDGDAIACDEVPVTPAGNTGVGFFDLKDHHCRYPVGTQRFCGERRRPGSSFCPDHHKICWRPRPTHGSIKRKV